MDIISYVHFVSWGPVTQDDTPDHTAHLPRFQQLRGLLCLFNSFSQTHRRAHPLPGSVLGAGVTQQRTGKTKVTGSQTVSVSF